MHIMQAKQEFGLISDFRHDLVEIRALLECYAAYSSNSLPTFRHNLSIPSWNWTKKEPKG